MTTAAYFTAVAPCDSAINTHRATRTMPSGAVVDILNPSPETIELVDMVQVMSRTYRFSGTASRNECLCEHSLYVAAMLRRTGANELTILYGLLHDAHEYIIQDIITPVANAINIAAGTDVIGPIKARIDRAIRKALHLPEPSPFALEAIKRADQLVFLAEYAELSEAKNWPALGYKTAPQTVSLDELSVGWLYSNPAKEFAHQLFALFADIGNLPPGKLQELADGA